MAYGTVNADVIGTSVAGSNLGAGNASAMKNRLINGSMVIDQRNAGASVTVPTSGSVYPVDRFSVNRTNGYSNTATAQQVTDGPSGFPKSLKYTSGTAETITGAWYSNIGQTIEGYNIADLGWGTSSALSATASFWVKISTTGTFGLVLRSGDASLSFATTFTVSSANTWQYVTLSIPAPTTGGTTAFPITNSTGVSVFFDLGTGPTLSISATGAWQSANALGVTGTTKLNSLTGATYQVTGVQLEVGGSATGFEYRQYTTELALCQRYYELVYLASGSRNSDNYGVSGSAFKVTKRAATTQTKITGDGVIAGYYVSPNVEGFVAYLTPLGVSSGYFPSYSASAEL